MPFMMPITLDPVFLNKLKVALENELPGMTSHRKMASRLRLEELKFNHDTSQALRSSVLILLYPKNGTVFTNFILRQTYDGVHSGQVSFPGGRVEPGDRTLIDTALREAHEEVNINPQKVQVLGTLSEIYIPPSNFKVLPIVAFSDEAPDFKPDENEVAEIIESDLNFLFDPNAKKEKILHSRGHEIEAPYYDVKGYVVWGATAMILNELKDIIESLEKRVN